LARSNSRKCSIATSGLAAEYAGSAVDTATGARSRRGGVGVLRGAAAFAADAGGVATFAPGVFDTVAFDAAGFGAGVAAVFFVAFFTAGFFIAVLRTAFFAIAFFVATVRAGFFAAAFFTPFFAAGLAAFFAGARFAAAALRGVDFFAAARLVADPPAAAFFATFFFATAFFPAAFFAAGFLVAGFFFATRFISIPRNRQAQAARSRGPS
jgi:hypothetical protein